MQNEGQPVCLVPRQGHTDHAVRSHVVTTLAKCTYIFPLVVRLLKQVIAVYKLNSSASSAVRYQRAYCYVVFKLLNLNRDVL